MIKRLLVLALAVAGCTAAPSAAASDSSGEQPRYTMHVVRTTLAPGRRVRTKVVLTDRRTGREHVVRAGDIRSGRGGRLLGGEPADGRFGAYIEESGDTTHTAVQVVVLDLVSGRATRRHTVVRYLGAPTLAAIDVLMLPGGPLAWLGPVSARHPGRQQIRVGVSRHSRLVAGGHGFEELGIEDGITLRWSVGARTYDYFDLRAPPLQDGCPRREHFKGVLSTASVLVTEATYDHHPGSLFGPRRTVYRACLRATGRDLVVVRGYFFYDGGHSPKIAVVSGDWLVVEVVDGDRYSCVWYAYTVNLRTGRRVLTADPLHGFGLSVDGANVLSCYGQFWPGPGTPVAVADNGAFAWIRTSAHDGEAPRSYLYAVVDQRGSVVVLDQGPADTITDLRSDGGPLAGSFTWKNQGIDRAVTMDH